MHTKSSLGVKVNLWILTEERPKKNVIKQILSKLAEDKKLKITVKEIHIKPIIEDKKFTFTYQVIGVDIESIDNIFMKIISGYGSFIDFLLFIQDNEPDKNSIPLYAIEETKTSDIESRNTGVYQRCSKFVYVDFYYPNCKKIMLYNIQIDVDKRPTETNIFGTRMLITLGVEILGKNLDSTVFKEFGSIDELINFKNSMRKAPAGNVPILIKKFDDCITISGRLYKAGGLSHDPNIGALTIIAKTLRRLGWDKDIIITQHGLSQKHVGRNNKFVKIANRIGIKLDNLQIPKSKLPEEYWHYEEESQKLVTIFLHLVLDEIDGIEAIYENHAGCERGYFKLPSGGYMTVHKYIKNDKSKGIINLPDLVIYDYKKKQILNIEGEVHSHIQEGINALKSFGPFEKEYIQEFYPNHQIVRCLVLFGGVANRIQSALVGQSPIIFLLNSNGEMIISENAPQIIRESIQKLL